MPGSRDGPARGTIRPGRTTGSRSGPDRAQSELLGFVLVFALVASLVAILTVVGFAQLGEVRDAERVDGAERAFEVLGRNVEAVRRGSAPSRATEVRLADAALFLGDPVTIRVEGQEVSGSGSFNRTFEVRPIVYRAPTGERIVFAQGAVIRQQEDGVVLVRDPSVLFTDRQVIVPVVRTRPVNPTYIDGSRRVTVRTEYNGSRVVRANDTRYNVSVTVESPRAVAWRRAFEAGGATCGTPSGDAVTCWRESDRVLVSVTRVDVRFV